MPSLFKTVTAGPHYTDNKPTGMNPLNYLGLYCTLKPGIESNPAGGYMKPGAPFKIVELAHSIQPKGNDDKKWFTVEQTPGGFQNVVERRHVHVLVGQACSQI